MTTLVACACGEVTGEACDWRGPTDETVLVEFMPRYLRASHEAARNSGVWPHNGAKRLHMYRECADLIVRTEDGWAEIVT